MIPLLILPLAQITMMVLVILSFWYNYNFYKNLSENRAPMPEVIKNLENVYFSMFVVALISVSLVIIITVMSLMKKN